MTDRHQQSDVTVNFLLCSERSGSNLIRVMLDSHSQIYAPGPTHIGRLCIPKLSKYGDLSADKNFRRLAEDVVALFDQKYSHFSYTVSAEEIMENVQFRHFCGIYEYLFKKGMLLHHKRQIFIKENHNYQFVDYWLRYFPNAKFIFQVRDPRDFYLSAKVYRPFLTQYHSPARTLRTWQTDQERSLRILLDLGPKRVFFQRYEDLISNPEDVLQRLCGFLDLPFEKSMLEFHKNESAKIDSRNRGRGWGNLSKNILQDNKEKYRDGLSRSEITWLEYHLRPHLQIFNYRPSCEKVSACLLAWSLTVAAVREFFANVYRIWRDSYRRCRDIVLKVLKIGEGVLKIRSA